ncbi:MAG: hypothetical protein LBC17_02935 [Lactobacillaceae bacterium]|jgi:hypothetical protein|nr:hypothetical protein [Lactobacillaceae bacterium]
MKVKMRINSNQIILILIFYLVFIWVDSTIYSSFTMMVVHQFSGNLRLLILGIESLMAVLIFLDTNKIHFLSRMSLKKYAYISLVGLFLFLIFPKIVLIEFISYTLITLSTSLLVLDISKMILDQNNDLEQGFLKLSNLKTFATLVGFAIGGLMMAKLIPTLFIFIIVIFLIFLFYSKYFPEVSLIQKYKNINFNSIKEKFLVIVLGLLVVNTSAWVPIVAANLQKNYANLNMLAFTLPGLMTLLLLRKVIKLNLIINMIMFIFESILMIYGDINKIVIFQLLILSLLVPTSLSISVHLRAKFLKINNNFDKKNLIQLLTVNSNILLLILTLISFVLEKVEIFLVLINIFFASLLIYKEKK